ncbi:hypothetical protein [Mariniluteicoccus flavus]
MAGRSDAVRRGAVALLLAATPALTLTPAVAAPTPTPTSSATSGTAFTPSDERITEASGMARDVGRQLYWITNDSGARGVIYAVGPDGRTRGTLNYAAEPVDVEALAMQGTRLFVGDIGDNTAKREKVSVFYFDAPAPDDDRSGTFRGWDFAYPDGPHDAETLLVDRTGRIFIVTKEAQGGIYAAPRQLRTTGVNQLTRVGDAPAFVTDGTFLPDGRIALRTYVSVEVLDGTLYSPLARAEAPFQPQGESMTVSLDGSSLLLGSEGVRAPVVRVPVPNQLLQTPGGVATPPPSPVPTPSATPTPAADEAAIAPRNRTGTLIAILLSLVASLAAAAVVWLRDRPKPRDRPTGDALQARKPAGENPGDAHAASQPTPPRPETPRHGPPPATPTTQPPQPPPPAPSKRPGPRRAIDFTAGDDKDDEKTMPRAVPDHLFRGSQARPPSDPPTTPRRAGLPNDLSKDPQDPFWRE